ncbi:cilia- and flagella-associated protein 58 [Orussus abietinus]|uniref:cilia- and flagella-associated protein 58 n=1 Tax=Orussus abietinus TaxID=222816 RepID=UPI000626D4A9|nr:cilia- and flagella-associated protein 58 [Orussus abietinus]
MDPTETKKDDGSEGSQSRSQRSSADSTFQTLEHDFAKISEEMKNNELLAPFEAEYTRLYELLYKTHGNEKDLTNRCKELEEDVEERKRKIRTLEEINQRNLVTNDKLKQEIINMTKRADAAHTREQAAQEVIENLRVSVAKLNSELEQKNKQMRMFEDNPVNKQRDGMANEREKLNGELETIKQRMKNMQTYNEELEKAARGAERQINELQEIIDAHLNTISKEQRGRENAEKEISQLQETIKMKNNELQVANSSIRTSVNNVLKLENILKEQKANNGKMQKEMNKLMLRVMNLQTDFDKAKIRIADLEKEKSEMSKECKLLANEAQRLKDGIQKFKAEKDSVLKRLSSEEKIRLKLEEQLTQARLDAENAEREIGIISKRLEVEKKITEGLQLEKEQTAKEASLMHETQKRLNVELAVSEQGRRKVESDLHDAMRVTGVIRNNVHVLEKERDKAKLEILDLTQQVEECMYTLELKRKEISDYKKRLIEADAKYKQQQNTFEAIRADRNSCSKKLTEAEEEVQELRSQQKIMRHQIEQLKDDIANRDEKFSKNEFLLKKAEKEMEASKVELQAVRKEISELHQEIEKMKQKEKQLRHAINSADVEISRQKKDIDTVMSERDILGTQLVRRNDELTLQYSKIKILNGTIQRGETQYNQRIEDIRLLRLEVKRLRDENNLLTKSINNTCDLRQEIFHLNKDLTKERLNVIALEEEMQNPLNIHRWRRLEGCDRSTYELMKKVQMLQKRVLRMSSELLEKENKIKETETIYMNLREILSRRPGPELAIALERTRMALRERGRKMKV